MNERKTLHTQAHSVVFIRALHFGKAVALHCFIDIVKMLDYPPSVTNFQAKKKIVTLDELC